MLFAKGAQFGQKQERISPTNVISNADGDADGSKIALTIVELKNDQLRLLLSVFLYIWLIADEVDVRLDPISK